MDVEHVGGERDGAHLRHAWGAVAPHEAEQRVHAPHPRPRQWAVEQRGGVATDDVGGGLSLTPQRVDIPHGVDAALDRIVARIDRLAAGCFPRMRFDQQAPHIEAHELGVGARGHPLPDIRVRNRVERFVNGRELIAPHSAQSQRNVTASSVRATAGPAPRPESAPRVGAASGCAVGGRSH